MMAISINENITHAFVPIDLSGFPPRLIYYEISSFFPRVLALMLNSPSLFLFSTSSWLFKGLLNVQESD